MVTSMTPPRGTAVVAMTSRLSSSFTWFLGSSTRGAFQVRVVRSSWMKPRATCSASPVSMAAPAEPAAPKARRANCSRAEAWRALFLMRSCAKPRIDSSFSSSSTSSPLTMAPTGLMTSWQTRLHSSAARSSASRVMAVMTSLRRPRPIGGSRSLGEYTGNADHGRRTKAGAPSGAGPSAADLLQHLRPGPVGGRGAALLGEAGAGLLGAEQEKALALDQEDGGIGATATPLRRCRRRSPRRRGRRPRARAGTPRGWPARRSARSAPPQSSSKSVRAGPGRAVDEIGHRIVAIERHARQRVREHALRGQAISRRRAPGRPSRRPAPRPRWRRERALSASYFARTVSWFDSVTCGRPAA